MAASGATPIILYHSTTGAAVPSNTNLAPGELAVNIADMKLFCENDSAVVTLLASADAAAGTFSSVDINGGSIDGVTLGTNSPVTEADIDNININGNTIISTNTDGNIDLTPNGTGEVNISKVDIDAGSIDGTTIGASSAGAGTFTDVTLNAQGDVRFADSDSSNYVAFQAPATVASNVTWTLPNADGTNGQALVTNGTGTLSWATGGGGGSPGGSDTQVQFNDGGSFGGDAGLTYNKTTDVLTVSGGAVLQGLTAGRGGGAVSGNTAFGLNALKVNTTGASNVAVGVNTLQDNTIGANNVAVGNQTLFSCTTGSQNICLGHNSGYRVTTGRNNVVVSPLENVFESNYLSAGTTNNIYMGVGADFPGGILSWNTSRGFAVDDQNIGRGSGRVVTNVAFGQNALNSCTTGENNTVIGTAAGNSLTTGAKNLSVYAGDLSGANRLSAGSVGLVTIGTVDAERLRIETAAFRAQLVYDQTTGSAANVFVASDGKMSRSTSSQRYKKNIQDAVHGLDKVLQLRPVTFNHINPDEAGIVYGGLIAEEVHNLGLTEFVEYTWDGKPDSLRYGHMVSVLVKAVQELNARVVALETQGA